MLPQSLLLIFLTIFSLWTSTSAQASGAAAFFSKKVIFSENITSSYPASATDVLTISTERNTQHTSAEADCGTADPVKIVVIGSSTAEGFGVEEEESWVGRYSAYLEALNPANEVVNLAKGGYNTYHLMPDGFSKADRESPDTDRNITKAVWHHPDGIIINLPSNDAAKNYTVEEQMDNFAVMYQTAQDAGIPVWITTTQPRNPLNSDQNELQEEVRDSIFSQYGIYALDFWTSVTEYRNGEPKIKEELRLDNDKIHLNSEGHRLLFEEVRDKLVYERIAQIYTSIQHGDYNSADTWNLNTVPGNEALVTVANGHAVSLSQNISPRFLKLEEHSTLDLKIYQLHANCAWDLQGTLDADQASLVLSGTDDVQLSNVSAVNHLTIDKESGTVSLGNDLTVSGTLQLARGSLSLNGYDLTLEKPLTLTGGSASAYVQTTGQGNPGDLVYALSNDVLGQDLVFPVGDAAHYTPFTINIQSATMADGKLWMSVSATPPVEAGTPDLLLSRQWNLRQEGLSDYLYNVTYQYLDEDIIPSEDPAEENLKVVKYSSETGWLIGGTVDTSTNTLSAEGINSFSIFSGGDNIEGAGPLPVELLDFQAKATPEGEAYLSWATASERNNHYFAIERSSDAEHWSAIAQVAGSGNSDNLKSYSFTDKYPLYGHSYYRLKQVDFDGQYEYSPIIAFYTEVAFPFQVTMGPNPLPAAESLLLNIMTDAPDTQAQIAIYDMLGQQIYQQSFKPAAKQVEILFPNLLHRGIYMVTVRQGFRVSQQKLWVR